MRKKQYGALETILTRNAMQVKLANRLSLVSVGAVAVGALGMVIGWWGMNLQPEVKYFLAREDGQISQIVPVNQAFQRDSDVLNFATKAITSALTLNFANYEADLSKSADFFVRPNGWASFLDALEGSGTEEFIKENRLVSTAIASQAFIVDRGVDSSGRYFYKVEVPLTLNYYSSSGERAFKYLATMTLVRLPAWQSPEGIGVNLVVMKSR